MAIVSSTRISVEIIHSTVCNTNTGQIPISFRINVIIMTGMMSPVNGIARRFVSRKCFGNVLKYSQASAPVVNWQEMDIEQTSHIHLVHLVIIPSSKTLPGHKPFSRGNMNAMPAIAAYDSWKPTDFTDNGDIVS